MAVFIFLQFCKATGVESFLTDLALRKKFEGIYYEQIFFMRCFNVQGIIF